MNVDVEPSAVLGANVLRRTPVQGATATIERREGVTLAEARPDADLLAKLRKLHSVTDDATDDATDCVLKFDGGAQLRDPRVVDRLDRELVCARPIHEWLHACALARQCGWGTSRRLGTKPEFRLSDAQLADLRTRRV